MTGVLHLQTRAYPLHHGAVALTTGQVSVPGRGEVRLVAGSLRSQAYNPEPTVEADLTTLVRGAVALPGTEIVRCRARQVPRARPPAPPGESRIADPPRIGLR